MPLKKFFCTLTETTVSNYKECIFKLQNDFSAKTTNNHFNNFVLESYQNELMPQWLIVIACLPQKLNNFISLLLKSHSHRNTNNFTAMQ